MNQQSNTPDGSLNTNFYCKVLIPDKNIQILSQNIISLVIRESVIDSFVPTLSLAFNDDGLYSEIYFLEDNEKIIVELGKTKDDPHLFIATFMLQDLHYNMISTNKASIIQLTALLYVPALYDQIHTRSFPNKSSLDVLVDLCYELELIEQHPQNFKTNDIQTWLQINQNNEDFIRSVIMRAYKPQDGILGYIEIDKTGNFNVRNKLVLTSLYSEIQKQGGKTAKYNLDNAGKDYFADNDPDKDTIFYNYLDFRNLNGEYNKISNYGLQYNYWNGTENITQQYRDSFHAFTDYSFKDKDNINNVVDSINLPTLSKNVHENYHTGMIQNKYHRYNFFSFGLCININSISNVKLMDKINLIVPTQPNLTDKQVNEILSGSYLVGNIMHSVSKGGIYLKSIILYRDGLNKSSFMKVNKNG